MRIQKVCFRLRESCMYNAYRLHFQNTLIWVIINMFCSKCMLYYLLFALYYFITCAWNNHKITRVVEKLEILEWQVPWILEAFRAKLLKMIFWVISLTLFSKNWGRRMSSNFHWCYGCWKKNTSYHLLSFKC